MSDITRIPALPDGFVPFVPRAPWWGGDLQTLRNMLVRPKSRLDEYRRQDMAFPMEDGTGDILSGILGLPDQRRADAPLAILVHGLTGCADSYYMHASSLMLLRRGLPVLRLNLRGAGPSRSACREFYHAGRSADLRTVLRQLPDRLTAGGVVLVGYSLGANLVLKLAGEDLGDPVRAVAGISAPIDLRAASLCMMRRRNWFYHRHLVRAMRAGALAGPLDPAEADAVRAAATCWDFDDRFVAPRHGWRGAGDYYAANSARHFLDAIRLPTLVVHALDDPWIPGSMYRAYDWSRNPRLVPVLANGGGHVGFHGADGTTWHDQCLSRFLDRLA
ncbi:MAG TPA: alpha/beta fold hydrolase [Arenibaculum sp.]|nr:alpha/beta fold hydrolase [Arenibaculum sp.]